MRIKKILNIVLLIYLAILTCSGGVWTSYPTIKSFNGNETFLASSPSNTEQISILDLENLSQPDFSGPIVMNGNPTSMGSPVGFAPPNTNYVGHGEIVLTGNIFSSGFTTGAGDVTNNNVFSNTNGGSTGGFGSYLGLNTPSSCIVTRLRIAPQPSGTIYGYNAGYTKESYMLGATYGYCTDTSFDSKTQLGSIPLNVNQPTLGWLFRFQYTEYLITNAPSESYYYVGWPNNYAEIAAWQWIGTGTTNGYPVAPIISPWGGNYTNNSVTVTLTDISTGASIYWTTNNWINSRLYSTPFVLTLLGNNITNAVNLQAIAVDNGLTQPISQISSNALFFNTGYVPLDNLRDQNGNLVDAHGGCILNDTFNGHGYFLYGDACNMAEDAPNINTSAGVNCYQSYDLLNWTYMGMVLGMPYYDSSYNMLEYRPKVIFNRLTQQYVLWNYMGNLASNYCDGIAISPSPTGPFTWVNTNALPFGGPGTNYGDLTIWVNPNTQTGYLIQNSNPPYGGVYIFQLGSAYTNWIPTDEATICPNYLESPTIMPNPNGGFNCLLSRGNYYDSTTTFYESNFYCPGNNPLGTWYIGAPVYPIDPLNIFGATPTNQYNCQIGFVFQSPFDTNVWMGIGDHWYHGNTLLWNIYNNNYYNAVNAPPWANNGNGTLYDSRFVQIPLTFYGTNVVAALNPNWYLFEWNKVFSIVGGPIMASTLYANGIASTGSRIPAAVSVGSSPFNFTNNTPNNLECYFTDTAAYSVGKNGVTVYGSAAGNEPLTLQPQSYCTLTYSSTTPTLNTNSW